MFFLVKGLLDRLVYLSAGLAVILAFIGVKLILHWAYVDIDDRIPEVPTPLSLGVIITILVIVVVASLLKTRNDPTAKGSTAAPQPIDLAAIIDQRVSTWSAALKETGVELVVDLDRPCWITATPGAMEQVLDNVLSNALAAAPAASKISLQARKTGELVISDQGPGMTAEQRSRAFDRFWRAGPPGTGTGLGLAIVKQLVEHDGGQVELREASGGGLAVHVVLRPAKR